MSDENTISVNFGKPMGLFPLAQVTLLPQQVLPLHVFEPRYKQLVERALDGSGQFAMAVFEGERWKQEYHGRPPVRRAVCIGQIAQHEKLGDGRYNLLLQGVCRARIVREVPAHDEVLYREAMLEPVGLASEETPALTDLRRRLGEWLSDGPLTQLATAEQVLEFVNNEEIPTAALLELLSFAVVSDNETRYLLLREGSAEARAELLEQELMTLRKLIRQAAWQRFDDLPKGVHWN